MKKDKKADMKIMLKEAFAAPKPKRKEEFIRQICVENAVTEMTMLSFLWVQITYIRKRVWLVSALVLLAGIWCTGYAGGESIAFAASILPFAAVCVLTESSRSEMYGMAELEMASRFSLKSVLLGRLSGIGIVHLGIFVILIPFVKNSIELSFLQTTVYLMVPYLLTAVSGLVVSRKLAGKDSIFLYMGIAVVISFLNIVLQRNSAVLYEAGTFVWWCVAALYLLFQMWNEFRKRVSWEDMVWN